MSNKTAAQLPDYIVILGPTTAGKSELALKMAEQFNGEVICADSRTIYKYLDIGTAKPSVEDRKRIKHHLLDLIEPDQSFTAAEFKRLSIEAIRDISARDRLPIVVGGSGLYISSLIYDYEFAGQPDSGLRDELVRMSIDELAVRLEQLDPRKYLEVDRRNPRRLIRAIEAVGIRPNRAAHISQGTLVLGISLNKEVAHRRIEERVRNMLKKGILAEVLRVAAKFGWDAQGLRSVGYGGFVKLAQNEATEDEAVALSVRETDQLYKKQMTWFRKMADVHWVQTGDEAIQLVGEFLGREV